MFDRWIEGGLLDVLDEEGIGCIVFSPLAQGLLTNKYLKGIPEDSRAGKPTGFLRPEQVTVEKITKVLGLREIARARGQTMAQLALAWVLRRPTVTSALIGASRVSQVEDCVAALDNLVFTEAELQAIEEILGV